MPTDIDDGRRAVARFLDGRVHKGITHDFAPTKTKFHLAPRGGGKPVEVEIASLKALFFVHSWEGDAKRVDDNTFDSAAGQGRRVVVTFVDDEKLAGFTMGYAADKPGFFVVPSDPLSNNARVFVVNTAVKKVEWVGAVHPAFKRVV
ncbi:MAG TPA: hypothetical protein VMT33_07115 [Candidatus Bathyarchaeia archaeon]|nr:hypothetical protein [Candidatus Bathyarchaeia archaeon]